MDPLIELRMQQHEPTMRQMVTEIHQGKLNIAQAAAKFEVNRKTVKRWLEKIETEHTEPVVKKKYSLRRTVEHDTAQLRELSIQIHSLKEELKEARYKALYYSTLVQVAEQELGLDIEKKSVTRQSGSCS